MNDEDFETQMLRTWGAELKDNKELNVITLLPFLPAYVTEVPCL
jgi:hypothetical protein